MTKPKLIGLFIMLLASLCGCQKDSGGEFPSGGKSFDLNVQFQAVVDEAPLQFNRAYNNPFNESFSVSAYKFYICKFDLVNTNTNTVFHLNPTGHYLIDAADAGNSLITGEADAAQYNQIAFTIGVDSLRNTSGAQTGALDPAKGMFWTWNSGYIMAKFEGTSPMSSQPNNKVEYHIGGFKAQESVSKRITLSFPMGKTLDFKPGSSGTIMITSNVNAWFSNPNDVKIAVNPVCMTPGSLALQIAENYSKMFRVKEVVN